MVVLKIIEEWMRHLNMKIVKRKELSFKNRLYSKLKEHLRYRPCKRFQVQFFRYYDITELINGSCLFLDKKIVQ